MSNVNFGTGTFQVQMNTSQMGQATGQALGYMQSLEQAVATNWWGIKNLGVAFAALPAAVAAGIGLAVRSAMQWEDAMAGVEKTTYDTSKSSEENAKSLGILEESLLSIARTKPIPSVEIAGIAENLAALGVLQEDIPRATAVVADFGSVTDASMEEAATALIRLAAVTNTPIAGLDNLASSILEAGRATAATETEIIAVSNRIKNVGGTFNVSAADIVGWSAAMASAGVRAEAAGTAFFKTFAGINKDISDNSDRLEIWAKLTNKSTEQFASGFREDASSAVAEVITSLAGVMKSGGDVNAVLTSLGITEARQTRLLLELAAAQNSTSNENIKLTNILGLANDAFNDGTATAEIAEKRYATLSSQLQILWNNFFELGNQIGSIFLPVLKALADGIQSLVAGFRVLPAGVKIVGAVLIGLVTAIFGLLAAVFLVVPRFVLAYSAMRQFSVSMQEAKVAAAQQAAGLSALNTAVANSATAAAVATVAASQSIAAQKALTAATLQRVQVMQVVQAAQARQNAAEAAYTKAEIAMSNARTGVAYAEGEAKLLSMMGTAGGADLVLKAQARLQVAEANLKAATAGLSAANKNLLATDEQLAVATKAVTVADREATIAKNAHTIATKEAAAANIVGSATNVEANKSTKNSIAGFFGLGRSADDAGKNISGMSKLATKAGKAIGYAAIAMTIFTIATSALGEQQRKAEEAAAKAENANKDLTASLVDGTDAGEKQVRSWIKSQAASKGLIKQAEDLGVTYNELFRIISGSATAGEYKNFIKALEDGNKAGKSGVKDFAGEVRELNRVVANSKDEALVQGASFESLSGSLDNASDSADDLASSLLSVEEAEQRVGASTALIDALFAQAGASFAVEDASRSLNEARSAGAKNALNVQKAEISLARARTSASRTTQAVEKAEENLATARIRQNEAVVKATIGLADARDQYANSLESVEEAEQNLRDLQNPAGTENLTKAVLGLAEAEKTLRGAQQKSSDAQWYLNYLREEGAGARDIKVANNEIADAALEVAQAQDAQGKAQEELAKLTDPAERAKAQAKAERDLAAARRGATTASLAITEAERTLSGARSDQAGNRIVRDAEQGLQDARAGVVDGVIAVKDAEQELDQARAEMSVDEVARASLAYEESLYRQAQAIAETRKQVLLLSGEEVNASDEAHILAESLQKVVDNAPDGAAKDKLQAYVDLLKEVPEIPNTAEDNLGAGDTAEGGAPPTGFATVDPLEGFKKKVEEPSLWDSIFTAIKDNLGLILGGIASFFGPALAGAMFPTAMAGSFAGPIGTIVGALVGLLVGGIVLLLQKFGGTIVDAIFSFVKNIPKYLLALGKVFVSFIKKLPGMIGFGVGFLLGFIARAVFTAIGGLGKLIWELGKGLWEAIKLVIKGIQYLFSDEFGQMMEGAIKTAWGKITSGQFWSDLFRTLGDGIIAAAYMIQGIGADIVKGLWEGFKSAWPEGADWLYEQFWKMIAWLQEFFGIASPSKLMMEIGGWIIEGLWSGIRAAWDAGWEFFTGLGGAIVDILKTAGTWLLETGGSIVSGLWSGIKGGWDLIFAWFKGLGTKAVDAIETAFDLVGDGAGKLLQVGKDIMQGMWDGIKEIWGGLIEWLKDKMDLIPDVIKEFFDISSPSRLMTKLGTHIGDGLGIGLKSGMSGAISDFEKMAKELDPALIQDQFKNFGIDSLDVSAFTGSATPVPTDIGLTSPVKDPETIGVSADNGAKREPHYHLEAITAANPKEIFDEFAWQENIKTRGNV